MSKERIPKAPEDKQGKQDNTEGYPLYPPKDDIYKRAKEKKDIDPDDFSKLRDKTKEEDDLVPEETLNEEIPFDDLDVPGSELDDEQEEVGSEDEENNYYSIGGEKHHDLEEDHGEEEDIP